MPASPFPLVCLLTGAVLVLAGPARAAIVHIGSAFGTGATVELSDPEADTTPARFARGRSR